VVEGTEAVAKQLTDAEQARRALEKANKPAGETPFTPPSWWCGGEYGPCEGEAGESAGGEGCVGSNACTATNHSNAGCKLQLVIGESKGWVYARGWIGCGGDLPRFSELEVCIVGQSDGLEVSPGYGLCGLAGSGYNPYNGQAGGGLSSTLYAHEHMECEGETSYVGWGWFWIPGMKGGDQRYTHGWTCKSSLLDEVWNLSEAGGEGIPPIGIPGA
ncbi:MAG TPA: hypothetical protein VK790_08130, partial [Solirubrobacteraceae bacterium]|nr:hypothetical protein [Solirubrobacteraceae bacterium]